MGNLLYASAGEGFIIWTVRDAPEGTKHSHISIVWLNSYVNKGHVTAFCARYFNSFHKNVFMERSDKTAGKIVTVDTIICAVEF